MKATNRRYPRLFSVLLSLSCLVGAMMLTPSGQSTLARPAAEPSSAPQVPVGTGFTYQGQLKSGGNPANGQYDLQFKLYDALSGGTQVGSTLTVSNQTVTEGLFTVPLDFGANAFQGDARWLEIAVRQTGGGTYTTLSPRQPLTAVPYAMSLATGSSGAVISTTVAGPALAITNSNTIGIGVLGYDLNGYGVYGNTGGGYGVYGNSSGGTGVRGNSTSGTGYGVWGSSSGSGYGVYGAGGTGVRGESTSGDGVYGTTSSSASRGVYGVNNSNGDGVRGSSNGGIGVYGISSSNVGVYGYSSSDAGVRGDSVSSTGYGVYGLNSSGTGWGVFGVNNTNDADARGVVGSSNSGWGVTGLSTSGRGVVGTSSTGHGVLGTTSNTGGTAAGVKGEANVTNGFGVAGSSSGNSGRGVFGYSNNGSGIGVQGQNDSANGWGVFGVADYDNGRGVVGHASGNNGIGIYGIGGTGNTPYAGYFYGDIGVYGNCYGCLGPNGIDDPLDPENKYLYHIAVQSQEMLDIYSGNVTTDPNGDAVVTLPDWFQALNKDFRYQLTPVGQFAQVIVASEVKNNSFSVKTDKPNVKVSWQVTGVRNDPYAQARPMEVEVDKAKEDQGKYLHPEAYGQPESMGIGYADKEKALQAAAGPQKP
jgi:hypothetical protein